MSNPRTLMTGIAFGESPRWHEGRLWFSDWGAEELIAVDLEGRSEVVLQVPSFPFSIDWLPDGRLQVVSARAGELLVREADGTLVTRVDLSRIADPVPGNEIVVDGRGNTYVNGGGFDLLAGEPFAPGIIALVTLDGEARAVADDLHFPNGMVVTPDNATLIVAESYAKRLTAFDIAPDGELSNRRVWAELGNGVPDGLSLDADGAIWYADVPNQTCIRVREGGEELDRVELDQGCFACMLGGADGTTLFLVTREWRGRESMSDGKRDGRILTLGASVPAAGWPRSA